MQSQQMTAQQQAQNAQNVNLTNRKLIIKHGLDMMQQIYTTTIATNITGAVLNIPLRQVGFVKRLWVEVFATVNAPASNGQTLTKIGAGNIFSNVILTDLSNQQRINTTGWHLMQVATAKRRRVLGAAVTTDTPFGYGNNFTTTMFASQPTAGTTGNLRVFFEVPVTYTDHDLRGGIYMNVTNSTAYLQLTVNPNTFAVAAATDTTSSVYQSASTTAGNYTTMTITVYQNYIDQLPIGQNGGPLLPLLDMSVAYLLNNTTVTGVVANQDIPIPYANFRDFMSTTAIYDNGGTLGIGADINYWEIQTANFTAVRKVDPFEQALETRNIIADDTPAGMYYFDHRNRPISTIQYGNQQLVLNPITVNTGAAVLIGYEALAFISQITQAGSLFGT